jgi:hypothetical protein
LAYGFLNAWGNAQIEAAFTMLLDDYREPERALSELGWASRIGGDRYRRDSVQAFAYIRIDPRESVKLLTRTVAERPDDPDAHYLLAWAYTRLMRAQGIAPWADAQRHLQLGDALEHKGVKPSSLGYFFRGQAVWGSDPKEAVRTFEKAIHQASEEKRGTFIQAMLHQSRAINQIMYSLREGGDYQTAVGKLSFIVGGQPNKAYPRYLLSIAHLLAAEIYLAEGKPADAEEAYAASLKEAHEAQEVEPSSAKGYAAEAGYHESRSDFINAIAAWNHLDSSAIHQTESDRSERLEYQMRLHFWLGEYAAAERRRADRYGKLSAHDSQQLYDADEGFYEALIAASAGKLFQAERALADGVEGVRGRLEHALRLDAGYRLIGRPLPADLLTEEPDDTGELSPGWSTEFLRVLILYQRDEVDWKIVEKAATSDVQWADDGRLRMAGAHYFRGIRELAAGSRARAREALAQARDQYDNENYCFRAKLLLVKLEQDPAWPPWAVSNDLAAP